MLTRAYPALATVVCLASVGWVPRANAWEYPSIRVTGPWAVCIPGTATCGLAIEGGFDCDVLDISWVTGPSLDFETTDPQTATVAVTVRCNEACPFEQTITAGHQVVGVGIEGHLTMFHADTGPDTRTRLGIGEVVAIWTYDRVNAGWYIVGTPVNGGLSWLKQWWAITLIAPRAPGGQTVMAEFGFYPDSVICEVGFSVVPPTGEIFFNPQNVWHAPGNSSIMVDTWFDFQVQPTDVSFRAADFREWGDGRIDVWPDGFEFVIPEGWASNPYAPREDNRLLQSDGMGDHRAYAYGNIQHLAGVPTWFPDYVEIMHLDHQDIWQNTFGVTGRWNFYANGQGNAEVNGCSSPLMGPTAEPPRW